MPTEYLQLLNTETEYRTESKHFKIKTLRHEPHVLLIFKIEVKL
jgi:hypothetical protein